jgi:hypothetical protein
LWRVEPEEVMDKLHIHPSVIVSPLLRSVVTSDHLFVCLLLLIGIRDAGASLDGLTADLLGIVEEVNLLRIARLEMKHERTA